MEQVKSTLNDSEKISHIYLNIGTLRCELIWLLPFAIVLFPTGLRAAIGGEIMRAANVFAWLIFLAYFSKCKKHIFFGIVSVLCLVCFQMVNAISGVEGLKSILFNCCSSVLPVLVIYTRYTAPRFFSKLFGFWCKALGVAVLIILICGVIDLIGNQVLSRFFADLYGGTRPYYALIRQGRMVSFYGHTVSTAAIIILYFFSSAIGHKLKILNGNELVYLITSCIAMAMTSSKAGFLIILLGILVLNFNVKRVRYLLSFAIIIYIAYMLGFMDTLLSRISESLVAGDFTTGRNTAMAMLMSSGVLKFNFWSGQGVSIGTWSTELIAALEYPLLRMAYMYGIVYALIFGISAFVVPLIYLIRRKQYIIAICFVLLLIEINTFDGVASTGDMMFLYSVFTWLLMNLDLEFKQESPRKKIVWR